MANIYSIYFGSRKIVLFSDCKRYLKSTKGFYLKCTSAEDLAKILVFFKSSMQSVVYLFGNDSNLLLQWMIDSFIFIEAAGGLVINERDEILLIERNVVWDLPKGKVDPGELVKQAAMREVEEECGVKNLSTEKKIAETYHTYPLGNETVLKKTHWYLMRYSGSDKLVPQLEEGITQAVWVNPTDISNHLKNTYPSIVDVFRLAEKL